ncbi:hypothetical protein PoB_000481900 [Plakobranchus ocellatus]|uniref:Uncharacterized protein n=1 Tax=Plakobranchus ocellatus TaxID=259542 RepID=A0AAV3Y5V8_9GAST|nr:hypothetical protein PoB_000481900 [Plakobranchus ocellatus]
MDACPDELAMHVARDLESVSKEVDCQEIVRNTLISPYRPSTPTAEELHLVGLLCDDEPMGDGPVSAASVDVMEDGDEVSGYDGWDYEVLPELVAGIAKRQ